MLLFDDDEFRTQFWRRQHNPRQDSVHGYTIFSEGTSLDDLVTRIVISKHSGTDPCEGTGAPVDVEIALTPASGRTALYVRMSLEQFDRLTLDARAMLGLPFTPRIQE